jgi:hypothetical protein
MPSAAGATRLTVKRSDSIPEPANDRPARAHELLFLLSRQPRYYYDAEAVREPAVSKPSSTPWPMPAIHGGKYSQPHDPRVRSATKYARRDAPQSSDRHRRSVWTIATEPFRGSHTATFPTRLVEPCVLAGSSAAGCCTRCGRPWERVVEISYEPLSRRREGRKDRRVFELEQRQLRTARTTGWRSTCECGAEATPAVVLDPFAGTGTTLKVAKQHGRNAIGIELNAEYVDLIRRRCAGVVSNETHEEAA